MDNLESRLDRFGHAAANEAPALDEHGPFMSAVRRRNRTRAMRSSLLAVGGVALAAAALLVAAIVNPPRVPPRDPPPIEPSATPIAGARPTLGELNQVAWRADDPANLPLPDESSVGSGGVEPIHAGAAYSKRIMAELGL